MDGPNDVNFHCNCVTLLIISSPIFVFEKLQDRIKFTGYRRASIAIIYHSKSVIFLQKVMVHFCDY